MFFFFSVVITVISREILHHCGFYSIFLMTSDAGSLSWLTGHLYSSSGEMSTQVCCTFSNGVASFCCWVVIVRNFKKPSQSPLTHYSFHTSRHMPLTLYNVTTRVECLLSFLLSQAPCRRTPTLERKKEIQRPGVSWKVGRKEGGSGSRAEVKEKKKPLFF